MLGYEVPRDLRAVKLKDWPWYLIIPTAISVCLGSWGIDSTTLWFDEIMTLFAAQWPLYHTWEAPLIPYYFLMYGWTLTGDFSPDWWLRAFSLVTVSLAVGVTAYVGKTLAGRRVGLVAGMFLTLMPGVTRYAQEARVYALAMLLVALATLFFISAMRSQRWTWWILYAASLGSIGVFAPFAYAVVPAHALILVSDRKLRGSAKRWMLACLSNIPIVVFTIYLAVEFSSMHEWAPKPGIWELPNGLALVALNMSFGWVLVALSLLRRESLIWLLAVGLGLLSLWFISYGPSSFWIQRCLVPLAPLLALAASLGTKRLRVHSIVGIFAVLLLIAWPNYIADRQPDARGTNAFRFVELIDKFGEQGDVISTAGNFAFSWSIQRYLPNDDRFTYMSSSRGRIWVTDPDVECERLADFKVTDHDRLILCASLEDGRDAKS